MMKLHWSPRSPFVRKVLVCAQELGVQDRLSLVRTVASARDPHAGLMLDHPLSKIPTLVLEDGSSLMDSVVICEYLNDLVQGPMFPKEHEQKWKVLRWHALANGLMDVLILWRHERERTHPDNQLLAAYDQKFRASLAFFSAELPALSLQGVNMATIALACTLGYLDYRYVYTAWRERYPALAQWFMAWEERPSMVSTRAMDG